MRLHCPMMKVSSEMHRLPYTARVLALGLLAAQILATIQVYLSNIGLHGKLSALRHAGYLTVPNQRTMQSLQDFGPAFLGGLFFTFSVGAGLSVASLAAAWVWDHLFSRSKVLLIGLVLLWTGCMVALNHKGFSPMVTSYFLVVPPGVFGMAWRWMPPRSGQGDWRYRIAHVIPVVLLALLWTSQLGSRTFLDLRDYLLLSNPLGRRINAFYYDYTLYPAEVLKSLGQKMLKTCNLENVQQRSVIARLERELLRYDYLPTGIEAGADLNIVREGGMLAFQNEGRTVLRTTAAAFFANPKHVLRELSAGSDRYGFFRHFTFLSLLLGFPSGLYIIFYGLSRFLSSFFLDLRASSVVASSLCLLAGIVILIPLLHARGSKLEVKQVAEALESERWQERVAALRVAERKGMDFNGCHAYRSLLTSPHIAERYWLVRALGVSRQSDTYKDLLAFLDDPHPNVVSMAYYALGRRGDRRAVSEILSRIKTSDDWYSQWYGYKALRALGWKQTRSK
jgi:hypothetical protein